MTNSQKREEILKLITQVFDTIDPTKKNSAKMIAQTKHMTDAQFIAYMTTIVNDPKKHFYLEIEGFDNEPDYDKLDNASKIVGDDYCHLYDYIAMPHLSKDKKHPRYTKEKIFNGYINLRRVQQLVEVKSHIPTSVDKRDPKTGQVTLESKAARVSDAEQFALICQQNKNILKEFFGPRGGDPVMREQMERQINTSGGVELSEMTDNKLNKTSLNTANVYLTAAGFETDMVTKNGILPRTLERQYKDANTLKRDILKESIECLDEGAVKTANKNKFNNFLKDHDFKLDEIKTKSENDHAKYGTIDVDGKRVKVKINSNKCTITKENKLTHSNPDNNEIELGEVFKKMNNNKHREAILNHEIGHLKLHSLNPNTPLNDKDKNTNKVFDKSLNASEKENKTGFSELDDMLFGFSQDEYDKLGYSKHVHNTETDKNKTIRESRDKNLHTYEKYTNPNNSHTNEIEFEADEYARQHKHGNKLKSALRSEEKIIGKLGYNKNRKESQEDLNARFKALKDKTIDRSIYR